MKSIIYLALLTSTALGLASCEKEESTPPMPTTEEPTPTPSEMMARDLDGYYTATRVEADGINYLNVQGGYTSATLDFDYSPNDIPGYSLKGSAKWVFAYDGGREVVEGEYEIDGDEPDEMTFHSYDWPRDIGNEDSFFITAQIEQDYSDNITVIFTSEENIRFRIVARRD